MELVKKSEKYSIYKKRSGRFAVKDRFGNYLKGEEKAKLLASEGLIKLQAPAATPAEEAPQNEAAAEEAIHAEAQAEGVDH